MKKAIALALSAFAICANAATVKMASEDWVRRQFAKIGVRVSLAVSHTNANGTVTITSPFSDPEHPSARSIQLTFTPMVLRARTPRVAFSWTSLLFPSAYAGESDVGQVITMTVQSGSWTDQYGNTYDFDFGNGLELEDQNGETFPEIPETSHTHRIESGGDCLCEYSKMSDSEIAAEAEDNYPFPDMSYYANRDNWFDMSNWPSDRQRTKGGKTTYYIEDENGNLFDLDNVMQSDSFLDAMQACKQKIEEHQKLCRDKYKQACQCDDAGPHHQYVTTETWTCGANTYTKKVCQRNASHTEETGSKTHDYAGQSWTDNGSNHKKTCKCGQEYQTEGHSYGDWTNGGSVHTHTCTSCPHQESASHTFGAWYETGRSNGYIHERRDCSACPKYETRDTPDPQDPPMCTANNHVPNSDGTCGCLCGYYTPGATVTLTNCGRTVGVESSEERYHHWDESVTDSFGNPNCLCQCTKYHRMRTAGAYQTNQRKACPGICAYCDRKTTSGLNIADCDDNYHTPCQASDGHCGCLGGKLTAGNCEIKRFHIRKPGTCRCLGADGNGGSWHFRQEKAGCTQICSCDTEWGGEHLVCAAADMEQRTPTRTTPSNHTKYEGGRCGCKCGKYTNSNYADWASANLHNSNPYDCGCYCTHASVTQISPYHYWASGNCWCNCKDTAKDSLKQHHKVDGDCANVCYGHNHGSGLAGGFRYYQDEAGKGVHDPAIGQCGCKCRAFTGADYPASYSEFHNGHGNPSCLCQCGRTHKYFQEISCPGVCGVCDGNRDRTDFGMDLHTWYESCRCKCQKYLDHKFDPESCKCYCQQTSRWHDYEQISKELTDEYDCDICGEHIECYHCKDKCQRQKCGHEEEYDTEETHGEHPDDDDDPDHHWCNGECGCMDCGCPACYAGHGTCSTCGGECGEDDPDEPYGPDGPIDGPTDGPMDGSSDGPMA